MDRPNRRPNERGRRDDNRPPKSRYDTDRSRSPPTRDRRPDERRRDRSPPPPRGPRAQQPPRRNDRDPTRARDRPDNAPGPSAPPRGPGAQQSRTEPRGTQPGPRGVTDAKQSAATAAAAGVPMANGAAVAPEDEDSEAEMRRIMGFGAFRTTKNTKVPGNDKNYGVSKVKKAEYRQYMNRVGGFNRPLSPSRD